MKLVLAGLLINNLQKRALELDINKGDTLLGGRFKNVPMVVDEIGTDELGQPTVNGRKLLAYRIQKNMPKTGMSIPEEQYYDHLAMAANARWKKEVEAARAQFQQMRLRDNPDLKQGPIPLRSDWWERAQLKPLHVLPGDNDPKKLVVPVPLNPYRPGFAGKRLDNIPKTAGDERPSCNDPEPPMQQLRRKLQSKLIAPKAARTP